jgi:hypothetical protein
MAAKDMSDEELMNEAKRLTEARDSAAAQLKEMNATTEALGKEVKSFGKMQQDMDAAIKECEENNKSLDIL